MNIPKRCEYCRHFTIDKESVIGEGSCFRSGTGKPVQALARMVWDCFVAVEDTEAVARKLSNNFREVRHER